MDTHIELNKRIFAVYDTTIFPTFVPPSPSASKWPLIIRGIARRKKPDDRGVGDTIERLLSKMGGDQFAWLMDKLGIDCGCGDRQASLNAWYPYHQLAAGVSHGFPS